MNPTSIHKCAYFFSTAHSSTNLVPTHNYGLENIPNSNIILPPPF